MDINKNKNSDNLPLHPGDNNDNYEKMISFIDSLKIEDKSGDNIDNIFNNVNNLKNEEYSKNIKKENYLEDDKINDNFKVP